MDLDPRKFPRSLYMFRRYDSIFRGLFSSEKRVLERALGSKVAIEHVGSTAVEGLGGKRILDIIIGSKGPRLSDLKRMLERIGYIYVKKSGRPPRRLFFYRYRAYKGKRLRIHVHLCTYDGRDWKERIVFRDYLRRNKDKVLEYEAVKKRAVKLAKGSKRVYVMEKDLFVKKTLKKAVNEGF